MRNIPSPGSLSRLAIAVLACLTIATFTVPVKAWSGRGHKLVAFIAFQHLNPTAKAKVSELLALNPQFDDWINTIPANASDERKAVTPFLEAATWPDFIRTAPTYISDGANNGNFPPDTPEASQNVGYSDHFRHKYWHFINVPFTDDGTATLNPPGVNAQSEIELLRHDLGTASISDDKRSYALVWLIHLVGDVHQPLHAVARFTSTDVDGDSGGNDVNIHCGASLSCEDTLHAEWDHLLGDGASFSGLRANATTLDSGPVPAGANITDVGVWIQESVTLAKTHVYKAINGTRLGDPDATLNQAYITRARADAEKRVRLAGRRLAN